MVGKICEKGNLFVIVRNASCRLWRTALVQTST